MAWPVVLVMILCLCLLSGTHFSHHQSSIAWDEIKKQKEAGGYPWTHLSHDQDAEVWIDPVKLPRDITK